MAAFHHYSQLFLDEGQQALDDAERESLGFGRHGRPQ